MDLRALRYFAETARHGSFTRAADVLCVTQSAVSKLVKQLEDELGQVLLRRDARQVTLTDAGQVVYAHAQEALAVVDRLGRALHDLSDLAQGELVLGMPPMVNMFFPRWIQTFRQRHPGVQLQLHEAGGQVIEDLVRRGDLEVGAVVLPLAPGDDLDHAVIGRHALCMVGTRDAAWSRQRRPDLRHLDGQPVVLLSEEYGLTRLLDQALAQAGVRPKVVTRSGQWDFLLSMALAGLGTALLPQPLLARQKLPAHAVVQPLDTQALHWDVALVWHRERYLSHAARAWLSHCHVPAAPVR